MDHITKDIKKQIFRCVILIIIFLKWATLKWLLLDAKISVRIKHALISYSEGAALVFDYMTAFEPVIVHAV